MISEELIRLEKPVENTGLEDLLALHIKGKVREVYEIDDSHLLIAVSDRISAFDTVLGTVPFKGQVLGGIASWWFNEVKDIVNTHFLSAPHQAVSVVKKCLPLPVEIIVRGYLTGSSSTSIWTAYKSGKRMYCGHKLPEGLVKDRPLPEPLVTPTTKGKEGEHDELISADEIVSSGLVEKNLYAKIEETALALFKRGQEKAAGKGLILADTKYEFGIDYEGNLTLIDEVHTPDSSRYWFSDDYETRVAEGKSPRGLDKDYVRNYLLSNGYDGRGIPPKLPEDVKVEASKKYMELFKIITGSDFTPETGSLRTSVITYLKNNGFLK